MKTVPDYSRTYTKGNYATDLENLQEGMPFPDSETLGRNRLYRYNMKLFTGEYAENKNLITIINDKPEMLPYKVIPLNYFRLAISKLDELIFNNDPTISTGDVDQDKVVNKLVDKTGWVNSIRQAVKLCEIYGDSCIKTRADGCSVFSPTLAYKVVDPGDKTSTLAYVLHEVLYDIKGTGANRTYIPSHIRFIISCKGFDYERVFEYKGNNKSGIIGKPVRFKYKDRWIPREGRYYPSGIEAETVQWLSVNTESDGVYGESSFRQIRDIIFALEERLTTESWVVDNHAKPILIVGAASLVQDEKLGEYRLKVINGKYMLDRTGPGGQIASPEYLTWDGKNSESRQIREDLKDALYEISELGRSYLTGEWSGASISEETLNNMIKSAIDRAGRELNDLYYSIRKSLYVLCRFNNIDVNIEDLVIKFGIGRIDDNKTIADTCKVLTDIELMSKETQLVKMWGYTPDDAAVELEKIKKEKQEGIENDTNGEVETVIGIRGGQGVGGYAEEPGASEQPTYEGKPEQPGTTGE